MNVRTLHRSWAGGEITPELFARVDLTKNQTGLRTCRNFEVLPHGPVQNRAGYEYVLETKFSDKRSILVPFIFSSTQNYALEFGDLYLRIHTQGATLANAAQNITDVTQDNPGVVTYSGTDPANGDWVFLAAIGGMTQLNGRWVKVANVNAGANTFELTDLADNDIDTTDYDAYTSGGTMSPIFEVVTPYADTDLDDLELHYTQSADVLSLVHPGFAPRELRRLGATNWQIATPTFAPTIAAPAAPTLATVGAGGGTPITHSYVVTSVAADGLEESLASTAATQSYDLTVAGNSITVTVTPTVSGAVRYNIYKMDSGGVHGYIGQSDGTAFTDANITPDFSKTPPLNEAPFGSTDNYPGAVGYFSGRRWFGGTNNKQQNLWATRSGTESNMSYSIPTRDDDRIALRLTSRQANRIRHIVPMTHLLLLTSGAEWSLKTVNSDVITPTTVSYSPEDYIGASNVTPITAFGAVLYAFDRGGRVGEMRLGENIQGVYKITDASLLAPHLFDDYTLVGSAFTRARVPIAWWVRDDGTLLGQTYVPEHQVNGWHHHDTDGSFESVCSVPEGNEDALYAIIQREIDGRTVRYVERKHSRQFDDLEDCFFVDAGSTYDGSPTTTISGLWHLIGEEVSILADGAVQPRQTVAADGTITLEQEASKVHIGLPYVCDVETLPLTVEGAAAAGQAMMKNVNKAYVRLYRSSGIKVGPSLDKLTELKQRTNENYGTPPGLISGEFPLDLTPTWQRDGSVALRQENPLPVTLLSMALEVALGG